MRIAAAALILVLPAASAVADDAGMARIDGGVYTIGENGGASAAAPAHKVILEPFRIDRTEVTNAEFAEFLNARVEITAKRDIPAGTLSPGDISGPGAIRIVEDRTDGNWKAWISLNDSDARIAIVGGKFVPKPGFENHPVPESTWLGAKVYCEWRGKRLPTEAEWEAAARGKAGRTYPWGEAPPSRDRVVYGGGRGNTEAVGSKPAGATPEGVLDMAGSLAEWTSSRDRPYPYDATDGREAPDGRAARITRGGDYVFDTGPEKFRATFRTGFSRAPENGHRHIGFRCAKDAS